MADTKPSDGNQPDNLDEVAKEAVSKTDSVEAIQAKLRVYVDRIASGDGVEPGNVPFHREYFFSSSLIEADLTSFGKGTDTQQQVPWQDLKRRGLAQGRKGEVWSLGRQTDWDEYLAEAAKEYGFVTGRSKEPLAKDKDAALEILKLVAAGEDVRQDIDEKVARYIRSQKKEITGDPEEVEIPPKPTPKPKEEGSGEDEAPPVEQPSEVKKTQTGTGEEASTNSALAVQNINVAEGGNVTIHSVGGGEGGEDRGKKKRKKKEKKRRKKEERERNEAGKKEEGPKENPDTLQEILQQVLDAQKKLDEDRTSLQEEWARAQEEHRHNQEGLNSQRDQFEEERGQFEDDRRAEGQEENRQAPTRNASIIPMHATPKIRTIRDHIGSGSMRVAGLNTIKGPVAIPTPPPTPEPPTPPAEPASERENSPEEEESTKKTKKRA